MAVPVDFIRAVWWALPGPATVEQPREAKHQKREAGDDRNDEDDRVAGIHRSTLLAPEPDGDGWLAGAIVALRPGAVKRSLGDLGTCDW
jgi:hypothetical protein